MCRRVVSLLVLSVVLPLVGISHAQSDPLTCQRAVLKATTKFFKARVKALQKCEEGRAQGKHTDPCPCPGCASSAPGGKAQGKVDKAASKLRASIDLRCGGANQRCEAGGDDNLDYAALYGVSQCPNFENGACTQPIVANDCTGLRECVACIGGAVVDQFVPFLYADLDPAKFGASQAVAKTINRCQLAIGKEVAKFAVAKEKAVAKCWDARYRGKHGAGCPDSTASPVAARDALKAAAKIAKAESKKIVKLCKACGGLDRDCDNLVTAVNPGTPALGGSSGGDDLLLADIFTTVPDCPAVVAPPKADRGAVDCAAQNPLTTVADLVFCLDCVAEYSVDCFDAARVTAFAGMPPQCNAVAVPTPIATATATIVPTATATPTGAPTPTATLTPTTQDCGNGVIEGDEECDGAALGACSACNASCECCAVSGPCPDGRCCDPQDVCVVVPDNMVCVTRSGIGETCGSFGSTVQPCLVGLNCCDGPFCGLAISGARGAGGTFFSGTCCVPASGSCASGDECCSGKCGAGGLCEIDAGNGGPCGADAMPPPGITPGRFCCPGLDCCDGVSCEDLGDVFAMGGFFVGTCCGSVGTACSTGAECCSGSCSGSLICD